jgi:hypothetical protein
VECFQAAVNHPDVDTVVVGLANHMHEEAIAAAAAAAGDPLLAGVREVVYRRSLPLATANLRIVQASAGHLAGVVGAAVMVIDHVLSPDAVDRYVA